jgi:hypothetical protein
MNLSKTFNHDGHNTCPGGRCQGGAQRKTLLPLNFVYFVVEL